MNRLMGHTSNLLLVSSALGLILGNARAAESPAASSGVETVVVTAERRSEDVQKSSLSISVLSAKDLKMGGVAQPQDLNTVTSGLQLGLAGPTAQPYIRGVGNADNTGFAVSGVAFNVDGVYVAQPVAYGVSLYDLQRVEVLKGPQGTLYGRNATGGAINILTQEPTDTFGGYVGVDVNNFGLARLDGAVNIPLSDTLAVRGAFFEDARDGYLRDGTNDDDSQGGRIRLKWNPEDDLTVLLNFDVEHVGGSGPGGVFDIGPTYNVPHPTDGTLGPSSIGFVFVANPIVKPAIDENVYSVSSQIDWKRGNFTFTLIPSYRDVSVSSTSYAQGFLVHTLSNTYKETSVEGRVGYEDDSLKWVAGLYFFDQNQTVNFDLDFNVIQLSVRVPHLYTVSYAAFTQGTYSLTDDLRVIGGIRYSHEDQDGFGVDSYVSPPIGAFGFNANVASSAVDYKAGLEYDVSPLNMVYATVSTGYKAGGWFPSPAGPFGGNTFKPERLTAYQIGSRNQFFDRTLQVNLEGFYWDYRNKQETFGGIDGVGNLDNITENAANATSKGFDVDAVWAPTPIDKLNFGIEYLNAVYDRFTYISPIPSAGCANPAPLVIDCSGKQMSRSPMWSGNAGVDHTFNLGDSIGTIDVAGNLTFGASRWLAATYAANMHAPGYVEGNIFVTYTSPDSVYSVTAYVRNVGDEVVATNAYPSLLPNVSTLSINPPRTFGIQLNRSF